MHLRTVVYFVTTFTSCGVLDYPVYELWYTLLSYLRAVVYYIPPIYELLCTWLPCLRAVVDFITLFTSCGVLYNHDYELWCTLLPHLRDVVHLLIVSCFTSFRQYFSQRTAVFRHELWCSWLTLKGRSPECCRMWVRRILDAVNDLLQYTHLYGRSPLWTYNKEIYINGVDLRTEFFKAALATIFIRKISVLLLKVEKKAFPSECS